VAALGILREPVRLRRDATTGSLKQAERPTGRQRPAGRRYIKDRFVVGSKAFAIGRGRSG
jgi:hypothetical protein